MDADQQPVTLPSVEAGEVAPPLLRLPALAGHRDREAPHRPGEVAFGLRHLDAQPRGAVFEAGAVGLRDVAPPGHDGPWRHQDRVLREEGRSLLRRYGD